MALRPRLSAGLPLSNELMKRFQQNEPGVINQARQGQCYLIFGNLAVLIPLCRMVDPWLCVPAFQQVCYFGY